MTATIEILRGELERLFSLDEMTSMSRKLLGLDPEEVGGATAKGSFAKALTERCVDGDRIEALVDVILVSRHEVDPRVRDIAALLGSDELPPKTVIGEYTIDRKIGASDLGIVYMAQRKGKAYTLKTLRREAARDRRAVHRFLTANRLVATVRHEGLPQDIDAGELTTGVPGTQGIFFVAYEFIDAQPLSARFQRTGPQHLNELKTIFRGILEPLAALHKAQLVHGDLKLEHVLVSKGATPGQDGKIVLIDFGGDRLRPRLAAMNGGFGFLAVFGSPKTIAPEQVRGRTSDARTDVYSFGAMAYELLSGKPVFPVDSPTDAAFAHLANTPDAPSVKAPRGWIAREIDEWIMSMLAKDPAQRPRDAAALLETLDRLQRFATSKPGATKIAPEKVESLLGMLLAAPDDTESAIALEKAVDEGADPVRIATAFENAAQQMQVDTTDERETQKALLYRAARIFDSAARDKARAETIYAILLEMDPTDDIAMASLEQVRKALGKYNEIVEMLLTKSEAAAPGEDKARIMAEIGRLCAHELDDTEQALVAYTQALCEMPTDEEYASEVERFARQDMQRWSEVLASLTEASKSEQLSMTDRNSALALVGRWYESKLARPDLALMAFQQILVTDPANEVAHEGLTVIYRRAQQWPELAGILLARADAAATTKARDLKSEAAELLESKLNDPYRAKEIYESILAEDPGHVRAGDAVARILERAGDFQNLVRLLEKRAEARRGPERAEALSRVAEVYEDHLNDLTASTERYEEALAIDPLSLTALKGLDRIFNRTGKYRELLEVLERQIAVAATPRQKINLYERMASLHDEEFLDHASAAVALEEILKIDPANDAALTALARHYRALDKWEDAVKLYEKHASVTHDEARRIELVVSQARTLAEQVGSPERAIRAYEKVLQMSPGHAGALEALAHLRELSGDAHAALSAIEVLAGKAATPEAKAEQWMRAARLLEARGDRDGAIERYKLALEANPRDTAASAALRAAFAHRGDTASVVSLIERELSFAEGDLAKARLHAEMAKLYRDQIRDEPKADQMAKRALELDASNAEALMVLGDLAYDNGRFLEAQKHYESLVNRAGVLSKEDAIRCCVRYVEAIGKSTSASAPGSQPGASVPPPSMSGESVGRISVPPPSMRSPGNPKILAAVETLQKLAPTDPEVLARASRVVLEHGDAATARKMYEDLMARHSRTLAGADRAEALYGLGESTRRTGDLDAAIIPLREAATADPSNPEPLRALGKIYEAKENWPELLRTKKRRLDVAVGPERFDLLIEIGDVFFHRLADRSMAGKTYVAALEERPDDRKLLTRLMQLYSEEKDWGKLVEVVLRLAEHVEDPKQRAKYMHTAAIVSARQLHDPDQAIKFYERALEYDPSLVKALDEAIELRLAKNDHEGVENLLKMKLEQAKNVHDRVKLQETLDALGGLYQKFLNEPELAIDAYEAAHAFDPDNRDRETLLGELYASDVTQYLDKAVKSQTQILRRNPYRVESYKLLRKLFTEAKKADAAWCLCQALSVLNLAEPDEERFYKRHKTENAAPAQAALDENDWARISHYDQDMLLTRIFAMIQPTIIRTRTQPLEQMGYDPRYALDLTMHPYPVSQTLYYAAGVFGMTPPMVLQNPNDPSGLGFLHAQQPAIVLGRAAFEGNVPNQQLAFIAGRHLSYFRPGFYVRHLVPTGTGLKAWLFAAIKLSVPQFPVAADLQGQVNEAMAAMQHEFQGAHRERLASVVSKLLQAGGNLDLKKWVASIDLTADRAGFLLAHDLGMATEVMRATEEGASVPVKERLKEVVLFSVSEEYFALREKLMITVDT
jgi:tetratricopeptide (TPR) repeat protein/tRNA A-37 threonylcarbamoyl transferase component Bud32